MYPSVLLFVCHHIFPLKMNGWIGLIFTVRIYSLKGQKRNNSGDPGTCHPVPLSRSITTELLCKKIPTDSSAHHRTYKLSRTVKSGTDEQIFSFSCDLARYCSSMGIYFSAVHGRKHARGGPTELYLSHTLTHTSLCWYGEGAKCVGAMEGRIDRAAKECCKP